MNVLRARFAQRLGDGSESRGTEAARGSMESALTAPWRGRSWRIANRTAKVTSGPTPYADGTAVSTKDE
jgi:hypothetical protein